MINHDFFNALDELCKERDIDKEKMLEAVNKGIVNAYRKENNAEKKTFNAKVTFNEEKGEILIYKYYYVVEDDELDPDDLSKISLKTAKTIKRGAKLGSYFEVKQNVNPKDFSRLAVDVAKNMLNQEIKRLERERSYEYFKAHEDEMITGTITSINEKDVILDLGHDVSAILSKLEIPKEECHIKSKIKLYVSKVEQTPKGPRVFVSRSNKNLIKRLFEDYIPEVKDGVVEILGIARDVGSRTKVCVKSLDENVDAVGSCLGPKGKRIKDIIDAIGGEKIDIYEYSDDPKELIINALKPAEVIAVLFDQKAKEAKAIVPDDQFSLAIGKEGQNVKLAVQSCGWSKIDIKDVKTALEEGIDF